MIKKINKKLIQSIIMIAINIIRCGSIALSDKDKALAAVRQDGFALQFADATFRGDRACS